MIGISSQMNMKALSTRHFNYNSAEQAAWFLVWFSLPLSLKLNSACIIIATCIILVSFIRRPFIPDGRKVMYLLLPAIFFLWHAKELLSDHPLLLVWKETEKMLSFLVIPILFALSRITKETFTKMAMTGMIPALAIGGIIMLMAAGIRFAHTGNWNEFIYHNLAKPIHAGAIYLSLYLVFILFKLNDPAWFLNRPGLKIAIALFFLILMLLLASKLMIGLGLPLLIWHYRTFITGVWRNHMNLLLFLTMLIVFGAFPFLNRLQPLIHPNLEMVNSANFKNCPEPNGLNLRLIFCRFGLEILEEQHALLTGVGMSQSQALLNLKIIQYGLYTGTRKGTDTGYLNYNFHNQFIETLIRTGITGIVILILILFIFAIQLRDNLFAPKAFIYLITGFFLTESVLERQAGIVLFCLIYSAYFITDNQVVKTDDRAR